MARSAIKLTRDQREAIYQAVRTHLVGLSDVFTLLERQDDVPGAEKLARDLPTTSGYWRTSAGMRRGAAARSS
jgi:hypothetical protein